MADHVIKRIALSTLETCKEDAYNQMIENEAIADPHSSLAHLRYLGTHAQQSTCKVMDFRETVANNASEFRVRLIRDSDIHVGFILTRTSVTHVDDNVVHYKICTDNGTVLCTSSTVYDVLTKYSNREDDIIDLSFTDNNVCHMEGIPLVCIWGHNLSIIFDADVIMHPVVMHLEMDLRRELAMASRVYCSFGGSTCRVESGFIHTK